MGSDRRFIYISLKNVNIANNNPKGTKSTAMNDNPSTMEEMTMKMMTTSMTKRMFEDVSYTSCICNSEDETMLIEGPRKRMKMFENKRIQRLAKAIDENFTDRHVSSFLNGKRSSERTINIEYNDHDEQDDDVYSDDECAIIAGLASSMKQFLDLDLRDNDQHGEEKDEKEKKRTNT